MNNMFKNQNVVFDNHKFERRETCVFTLHRKHKKFHLFVIKEWVFILKLEWVSVSEIYGSC
jgi:hypothetical protein